MRQNKIQDIFEKVIDVIIMTMFTTIMIIGFSVVVVLLTK
jgi:hypothetical protein